MNRADRIRQRRNAPELRGYSGAVATALARIDDDDARNLIRRTLAASGVNDGPPRAYFVALLAHRITGGNYPSPPAAVQGAALQFVEQRVNDALNAGLTERLEAQRAARAHTAQARHDADDARGASDRREAAARRHA